MDDWRRSSRQDGVRPSEDGEPVGILAGERLRLGNDYLVVIWGNNYGITHLKLFKYLYN